MSTLQQDFIRFVVQANVLGFGQFITKAGRASPYFFNSGLFNDGILLGKLADFYARTLISSGTAFDMLYGPAYKGIPLVSAVAIALANHGHNTPFAFNRKEAKEHGEGGTLVGAPLDGRVIIVDDVISAGTSVNESVQIIRSAGAEPAGVLIALDRMERAGKDDALSELSAVQEVQRVHGIPVMPVATVQDLVEFLSDQKMSENFSRHLDAIHAYRARYGSH